MPLPGDAMRRFKMDCVTAVTVRIVYAKSKRLIVRHGVDTWRSLQRYRCLVYGQRCLQRTIRFRNPGTASPLYMEITVANEKEGHDSHDICNRIVVSLSSLSVLSFPAASCPLSQKYRDATDRIRDHCCGMQ